MFVFPFPCMQASYHIKMAASVCSPYSRPTIPPYNHSSSTIPTSTTMVTLLDILSLPSCGFTSIPKIMQYELNKALVLLTGEGNIVIQKDMLDELLARKKRRKEGKLKFIRLESNWLSSQVLQVKSRIYIPHNFHEYFIYIP